MRQLPVEVQEVVRATWLRGQVVPYQDLIRRYPEWREEIEEFVIGFLVDEVDELPEGDDKLEHTVFRILDGHDRPDREPRGVAPSPAVIDLERWRERKVEEEG